MATLTELNTLMNDPVLTDKVRAACIKTSVSVAFEATETVNHANRLIWAKTTLSDPVSMAPKVLKYVIAANASLAVSALTALDDTTIQSHVDASLLIFAS